MMPVCIHTWLMRSWVQRCRKGRRAYKWEWYSCKGFTPSSLIKNRRFKYGELTDVTLDCFPLWFDPFIISANQRLSAPYSSIKRQRITEESLLDLGYTIILVLVLEVDVARSWLGGSHDHLGTSSWSRHCSIQIWWWSHDHLDIGSWGKRQIQIIGRWTLSHQ